MEKKIYVSKYNKTLNSYFKLKLFISMLEIRIFEEKAIQAYQNNKVGGFCHTYIGQEAVAVGILSTLNAADCIITGYRDHAHALLLKTDPVFLMSELYGKYSGCSGGKGGSLHFFNKKKNFWGGHGIVAAQAPLGTGLAFSLKYKSCFNSKELCVCFLGEGSINQGVFYESINLAVLWKLPVLYVIENNKYSMGTKQTDSFVGMDISKRFKGFGVSWGRVKKGYCVYSIRDFMYKTLRNVRITNIPGVVEISTYRYKGHSMSDPDKTYRTKNEVSKYRGSCDPIKNFSLLLTQENLLNCSLVNKISELLTLNVNRYVDLSNKARYPGFRSLFNHIYWDIDHLYFKKSKGVCFF